LGDGRGLAVRLWVLGRRLRNRVSESSE
jgi:hypothetical protein